MSNKVVLQCMLLLLCAQRSLTEDRLMSVPETIEFVKLVYCGVGPWDGIREAQSRANPAARPALHRMLKDRAHRDEWPQVVVSFAYLGQKEDVAKLEKFLLSRRGILSTSEDNAVAMIFQAYGGMGARGVAEAKAKLKEMTTPHYWQGVQFLIYAEQPAGYPSFVNYMRLDALRGYAITLADDFGEVARALTDSASDLHERQTVEEQVEAAVELEHEYRKFSSESPRKN